jgi:hypothetical protein
MRQSGASDKHATETLVLLVGQFEHGRFATAQDG